MSKPVAMISARQRRFDSGLIRGSQSSSAVENYAAVIQERL